MVANRPWISADAIVVPGAQHPLLKHLKNILPKFDLDNDVSHEDHMKQFMFSLRLMDMHHEDVVYRLFPYTFISKASTWFLVLP